MILAVECTGMSQYTKLNDRVTCKIWCNNDKKERYYFLVWKVIYYIFEEIENLNVALNGFSSI